MAVPAELFRQKFHGASSGFCGHGWRVRGLLLHRPGGFPSSAPRGNESVSEKRTQALRKVLGLTRSHLQLLESGRHGLRDHCGITLDSLGTLGPRPPQSAFKRPCLRCEIVSGIRSVCTYPRKSRSSTIRLPSAISKLDSREARGVDSPGEAGEQCARNGIVVGRSRALSLSVLSTGL
jgi:hypothetical protein